MLKGKTDSCCALTMCSTLEDCTLEYIQSLPLETVHAYALKYLKMTVQKRELNRAYRQLDYVKDQRRKYYYIRNDIYHPKYNCAGTVEKRHKKIINTVEEDDV